MINVIINIILSYHIRSYQIKSYQYHFLITDKQWNLCRSFHHFIMSPSLVTVNRSDDQKTIKKKQRCKADRVDLRDALDALPWCMQGFCATSLNSSQTSFQNLIWFDLILSIDNRIDKMISFDLIWFDDLNLSWLWWS